MIYVDGGATLRKFTAPGARLIDIGCGTGKTVASYREGMDRVEIFGVDGYFEPADVDPGIAYTKQDLDGGMLPYDSGSFDVAVLCHILEHVRSPVTLIQETQRILKPGGIIYVETPSVRSLWTPQVPLFNEQYSAANFYDDYTHVGRPQTIHSLYHLLNRNGFEIVEVRYARPRNWAYRGVRYVLSGLKHRKRPTLCTGLWFLVGWAVYGIARKVEGKLVASYV